MKVIGLTGGISCGKTAVASVFMQDGITVIDCDEIARVVAEKGAWGYRRLQRAFEGQDIFHNDGSLDRQKLGALVFRDAAARRKVNAALHFPIMVELTRRLIGSWLACKQLVVVDMPLLFEVGAWHLTSLNIVVHCSEDIQIRRLRARDSIDEEAALQKIRAQMPLANKICLANVSLENNSSLEDLKDQAHHLAKTLQNQSYWHGVMLSPPSIGVAALAVAVALHSWL